MNSLDASSMWGMLEPDFSLRLTLTLFHFLWQGCFLGLLGAAAGRCLKGASSRARYAVFVAILFLMGSTVCGTYLLTGGREKTRPAASTPLKSPAPIANVAPAMMPRLDSTPAIAPEVASNLGRASAPSSEPAVDTARPSSAPTASPPTEPGIESYAPLVVAAYLIGALLMLARLTFALWGGRRLRLSAVPIQEGPFAVAVARQAARIGLKAVPIVAWCRRTSVPVVAGVFRPMILLPATLATGFDSSQLEALITHELAHIRRYDPLVNVLQRLIEAALFFHPAVWYISRRVSAERENACDDLVLLAGWPAAGYAQALLDMAELCAAPRGIAQEGALLAAGGNGSSQFKRRVLRLLEIDDAPRVRLSRGGALLLMAAAVLLLTIPALIGPVTGKTQKAIAAEADSDPTKESTPSAVDKRDLYGDPLPAGAILRLGTTRLRHSTYLLNVTFSPDGRTLATVGNSDSEVRLWDVKTGRLIRAFRAPVGDPPTVAAFSPNGARLAVACFRGGVQLWDVASGLEVWETPERHDRAWIVALAFAPDGHSFVTSSQQRDGAIRLWDADNRGRQRLLVHFEDGNLAPRLLAFSPDAKLLAYNERRDIHIYNLERGVESGKFVKAHGEILSLTFGPDGKTLFSGGNSLYRRVPGKPNHVESDPRVRMWDIASGKLIREFAEAGPDTDACAAVLSRDGRTLASRQSNSIKLWDVSSGKVVRTIPGFWLPAAASDKTIHNGWAVTHNGLALSPDASLLACTNHPLHTITLWDTATGRRKLDFPDSHCERVEGLACSPDGSRIATAGGKDGTVRLWDAASGKALRTFVIGDSYPCGARSVAFSSDGKSVIAGGPNYKDARDTGIVRIWDVESGAVRLELRTGTDVVKVALSHDGNTLAIATSKFQEFFIDRSGRELAQQRTLRLVDVKTGAERRQIELGGYPKSLAFSADGRRVSVVGNDSVITTWDVATGKLAHPAAGGGRPRVMVAAAIANDGTLAAVSCFRTDRATLWDLANGTQIGQVTLENEGNTWSELAISPDKRLLASASLGAEDLSPEKHSIRLWDIHSGRLLKRFERPLCNRVQSMEFAADGRRLISGMSDGTCLVWDVSGL
jgi:WD40 repeat protein/beta-lactamase regulating signal transducer with metallopeptidase domain